MWGLSRRPSKLVLAFAAALLLAGPPAVAQTPAPLPASLQLVQQTLTNMGYEPKINAKTLLADINLLLADAGNSRAIWDPPAAK